MSKRGPDGSVWAEDGNWKNGKIANADEKLAYIAWLSLPPSERSPSTKKDMAEQLGVTTRTLHNWERQSEVIQAVHSNISGALRVEKMPAILDELMSIVKTGDRDAARVSAARTLISHMQWLSERVSEFDADEWVASLSDDELRAAMDAIYDRVEGDGKADEASA